VTERGGQRARLTESETAFRRFPILSLLVLTLWVSSCSYFRKSPRVPSQVMSSALVEITPENAAQIARIARWGEGSVYGMALSPNGELLAVATSRGIRIYDASNLKLLPRVLLSDKMMLNVAFSPDGLTLAAVGNGIELIELRTGASRALFKRTSEATNRVAQFSPDGRFLFTLGPYFTKPENISVWNVQTGQLQMELSGHTEFIQAIAISPDGERLASSDFSQNLIIWNLRTGISIKTLRTFQQGQSLIFDRAGKALVSGENNGYIEVWNADSWGEPKRIQEQRDEISSLRMSPDGTGSRVHRSMAVSSSWMSTPGVPSRDSTQPSSGEAP
jgi:WD40 repeat protein